MTQELLLLITLLTFVGCKKSESIQSTIPEINKTIKDTVIEIETPVFDSTILNLTFIATDDYQVTKSDIAFQKRNFKKEFDIDSTEAIQDASAFIYDNLLNHIVPHWYGTTWDFNGHTNVPNNGEIACGYFVSTTLRHLDFKVNRYKMAQQGGTNMAIALQPKSQLKTFSKIPFATLKQKLNSTYKDGIYFVGLDNHVGYVLIKDKEIYFLHSSYCDNKVVIELAETSPCFNSNIYVFAEISTNQKLVKKWIFDEQLTIPLA